jgi:hypothetical protein
MRILGAIAAIILLVVNFAAYGGAYESAQSDQSSPISQTKPRFPIQVPPASEVLARLRTLTQVRPVQPQKTEEESPQVRMLRQLKKTGGFVRLPEPQCFRSIPTKNEFLRMVQKDPADANQILQRCHLNLTGISPLPQLPTGVRQLPEDTRQRPVGTW